MRQVLLCAALAAVSACAVVPDRRWTVAPVEDPQVATGASGVRVLQFDEGGGGTKGARSAAFDQRDVDAVHAWLDDGGSSPIVIFVHGWHHNATGCKANLRQFRTFTQDLGKRICAGSGNTAGCSDVKGVFVGWRGDSLDGRVAGAKGEMWDLPTIFGRKRASKRVGQGEFSEFVAKVAEQHKDRNVIFAGHSLGANALYHAIAERGGDVEDKHEFVLLNAAISTRELSRIEVETVPPSPPLDFKSSGMLKSAAFAPTSVMAVLDRSHRKILLMQAENDFAVRIPYGIFFKGAAGFDKDRWTHSASMLPGYLDDLSEAEREQCSRNIQGMQLLVREDLRRRGACGEAWRNHTWVVRADETVSDGHGGVWGNAQLAALSQLIAERTDKVALSGAPAPEAAAMVPVVSPAPEPDPSDADRCLLSKSSP